VDLERLYLDYNATSPLSQSVIDWLKSGDFFYANPAGQHSFGKAARKQINKDRSQIYSCFGIDEKKFNLFFHSGATEGITGFAFSFIHWVRSLGKRLLICYSNLDHPAVTTLADKFVGADVEFFKLKMNRDLGYDHSANFKSLELAKGNDPDLVILYHHLWVHNETGAVAALEELNVFKGIKDLYIHVDAVQAPGKIPDWQKLIIGDIWTFSAHKFGALKGIGFSFFPKDLPYFPLFRGGGQQQGLRGGTENPMGIQSIKLALRDLQEVDVPTVMELKKDLLNFLQKKLDGKGEIISGHGQKQNSNTIYFYFHQLASDIALALFDLNGLMLSAGSACSSGAARPSAVLNHLGLESKACHGLRLSFSYQITAREMVELKDRFSQILVKME
jgi:cysteine desulfurase